MAVRWRKPAVGIVIVAEASFSGTLEEIAAQVVQRLAQLDGALIGKLTVLEGERTRDRELASPSNEEGQ